jgi:hypothetical protein
MERCFSWAAVAGEFQVAGVRVVPTSKRLRRERFNDLVARRELPRAEVRDFPVAGLINSNGRGLLLGLEHDERAR